MVGLIPILRAGVSGRNNFDPAFVDPATIRWAIHAGLGPLICHIGRNHLSGMADATSRDLLKSADLVAQLAMPDALDALEEILAASPDIAREIILLKGISTCQYLYPEPHLRTIGDIDLLVPVHSQLRLETLLFDLGYRQQSNRPAAYYQTHHHSMPFFHPVKQLWVEVHTALFSNANASSDPVFSPSRISTQTVPMTFRGHVTNRLSFKQEMIYTAAHWALERKCFAGGALPFVELALMVRSQGDTLDWNQVLMGLHGSQAAAYLFLMLGFLRKHEIVSVPPTVTKQLSALPRYSLGRNEPILHGMIEKYSMQGTPFGNILTEATLNIIWDTLLEPQPAWKNILRVSGNILFPPGQPRRFSLRFQFARLARLLGLR